MSEGENNGYSTTSLKETPTLSLIKPKDHLVNIQLDETNFLLWKYQVQTAIEGYGLENFINETIAILAKMIIDKRKAYKRSRIYKIQETRQLIICMTTVFNKFNLSITNC